ncbi:MAG: HAD family phosphatase [Bdellovibrionales bacterium]|nr:HAD family phosphatase [Bdellovibrionales bacterium]
MIRHACFDLDGTLINGAGDITQGVRSALHDLAAAGVTLSVVSGRPRFAACPLMAGLPFSGPHVFFSGALIESHDRAEALHEAPLGVSALLALIEFSRTEGVPLELYGRDAYYVEAITPLNRLHAEVYLKQFPVEHPLDDIASTVPVLKAVVIAKSAAEATRFEAMLRGVPELTFTTARGAAHPDLLFFSATSPAASRERALDLLISATGIPAGDMAAFGDSDSDVTFLAGVGFGVAVANATQSAKAAARYHTGSVEEDGVAIAVRAILDDRLHELRSNR